MHDLHISMSFKLSRLLTNVALAYSPGTVHINSSGFLFRVGRVDLGLSSSNLDAVANIDPINICTADLCGREVQGVGLRPLASRITGSNPAGAWLSVCCECCVLSLRYRPLRLTDHSSRGVLSSVVCLRVIAEPRRWGGSGSLGNVEPWKIYIRCIIVQNVVNFCTSFNERAVLDKWKDNLLNFGKKGDCIMWLFHIAEWNASWIWYILLTAIGLSPGGSSTVHIYTQTIHRTIKTTIHTIIQQFWKSAGRAPSWLVLPWHFPYNRGKSTEKPQSG